MKSQNNEDFIIENIFNKLQIKEGTFLEIGINHKGEGSGLDGLEGNTVKLKNEGWTGTWIDAATKDKRVVNKFITVDNIEEVLNTYTNGKLDLFSIDIDSHDWHVVRKVLESKCCDIEVFCVETNSYRNDINDDLVLRLDSPPRGPKKSNCFGATLKAYNLLMTKHGYTLVATSDKGINGFFVKTKYAELFENAGVIEKFFKHTDVINGWSRPGNMSTMVSAKEMLG